MFDKVTTLITMGVCLIGGLFIGCFSTLTLLVKGGRL